MSPDAVAAVCRTLGFVTCDLLWSGDELLHCGWTAELLERLRAVAEAMERAADGVAAGGGAGGQRK